MNVEIDEDGPFPGLVPSIDVFGVIVGVEPGKLGVADGLLMLNCGR